MTIKHNILITGGAGFIGSQVTLELLANGHTVTVIDRDPVRTVLVKQFGANVLIGDYADILPHIHIPFDTVIHLAADHQVEQSMSEPSKFYLNNVVKLRSLLDCIVEKGIENIIFSSSAGVYGHTGSLLPLSENTPYSSLNPYSSTKITDELMIKDYARAYNINYVMFRYFNAGGADPQCRIGYTQRPATHVIPILCNKIINNQPFSIYGNDYDTRDGTCIRDYVHVQDIANAHTCALEMLDAGINDRTFNLGGGNAGISVKELVAHVEQYVNKKATVVYADRRAGDPACLIADIGHAERLLRWQPKYNIVDIIKDAWTWENKNELL